MQWVRWVQCGAVDGVLRAWPAGRGQGCGLWGWGVRRHRHAEAVTASAAAATDTAAPPVWHPPGKGCAQTCGPCGGAWRAGRVWCMMGAVRLVERTGVE